MVIERMQVLFRVIDFPHDLIRHSPANVPLPHINEFYSEG